MIPPVILSAAKNPRLALATEYGRLNVSVQNLLAKRVVGMLPTNHRLFTRSSRK
jgi:hypothetical protein